VIGPVFALKIETTREYDSALNAVHAGRKVTTMRIAMAVLLTAISIGAWAQNLGFPLDGAPAWYEITGDGTTTGVACPIRSIETRQVVAQADPGYRFIAFGANARWVTLAFNGIMSYVPATAAAPVFVVPRPASETSSEMRLPGKTLEQQAKEIQERAEASKSGTKPLAPNFTNRPTPRPTPMAVQGGGMYGGRGGGMQGNIAL
jgi:hypothetical protein